MKKDSKFIFLAFVSISFILGLVTGKKELKSNLSSKNQVYKVKVNTKSLTKPLNLLVKNTDVKPKHHENSSVSNFQKITKLSSPEVFLNLSGYQKEELISELSRIINDKKERLLLRRHSFIALQRISELEKRPEIYKSLKESSPLVRYLSSLKSHKILAMVKK